MNRFDTFTEEEKRTLHDALLDALEQAHNRGESNSNRITIESVINKGISKTRRVRSYASPEEKVNTLASAMESLLVALALHHGCELDSQTERHSIAAVRDPIKISQ